MTRDDIIRVAAECGFHTNIHHPDVREIRLKRFVDFAAIIAAAEREECAKVCESYDDDAGAGEAWAFRFAQLIRARGEK